MRRFAVHRLGRTVRLAAGLGLTGLVAMLTAVPQGGATPAPGARQQAAESRPACPAPAGPGWMQCQALRLDTRPSVAGAVLAGPVPGSYGAGDLQSAYNLAAAARSNGQGQTVAVVDAFHDPHAAADLASYRSLYGLPPCTVASGCFRQINQYGQAAPLPGTDPSGGWEFEESLDTDMVSAICPHCSIVVVETDSTASADMFPAVDTAVRLGAKFVSASWDGGFDYPGDQVYDERYFDHPGVAITFASNDHGYGADYPASSQLVTSVGGTYLTRDPRTARGWNETAWRYTGSGCSAGSAKPAWQADTGCLNRTENDVAAAADGPHGIAVYDTYPQAGADPGWATAGGTSAAAPLIASVYALAGPPAAGTYPSSYLYRSRRSAAFNDVTGGSNGNCEPWRRYLCMAGRGYDGPAGLGTPDGTTGFASAANAGALTLVNPGTQDLATGAPARLRIRWAGRGAGPVGPVFTATGLPPGLRIGRAGDITGTPQVPGASTVTIKADSRGQATAAVSFTIVTVRPLRTSFHPAGPVRLELNGMCLDAAGGTQVHVSPCTGGAAQDWQYLPGARPGGAGSVTNGGKCLTLGPHGPAVMRACTNGVGQQWRRTWAGLDGYNPGALFNTAAGRCLDGTSSGVTAHPCTSSASQTWSLPAGPVQSGITGMCLDDGTSTGGGTRVEVRHCGGTDAQEWTAGPDGSLRTHGACLTVSRSSPSDGAAVQLGPCHPSTDHSQLWAITTTGQLMNGASDRCLTVLGDNTASDAQLVQQDCYGTAGQIWAIG